MLPEVHSLIFYMYRSNFLYCSDIVNVTFLDIVAWHGKASVDLYSTIVTKVSSALLYGVFDHALFHRGHTLQKLQLERPKFGHTKTLGFGFGCFDKNPKFMVFVGCHYSHQFLESS